MRINRKLSRRTKLSLVGIGIIITFVFAVFPERILDVLGLDASSNMAFSQAFALVNNILLVFLSFVGQKVRMEMTILADSSSLVESFPQVDGNAIAVATPYSSILIFGEFPTFKEQRRVVTLLRKSAILANLKPIQTNDESTMRELLKTDQILGVIADSKHYDKVIANIRGSGGMFFVIYAGQYLEKRGGGRTVDLKIPESNLDESLYGVAEVLTTCHGLDTRRGVGFHGNWAGTYGIISMKQNRDMTVQGKYWYGSGTISGCCDIDEHKEQVILQYEWSQHHNRREVGSHASGTGIFVIPAGCEFFYGYWARDDNPVTSQGWCAARLSKDITENILNGGSYALDFGLHNHPKDEIIKW